MAKASYARCDYLKGGIVVLASEDFDISQMNAHQLLNSRELSSALVRYFGRVTY
jgi:hypothetical protein